MDVCGSFSIPKQLESRLPRLLHISLYEKSMRSPYCEDDTLVDGTYLFSRVYLLNRYDEHERAPAIAHLD